METMTPKTSQSNPLQFDAIAIGNGKLRMTFCPGKKPTDFNDWPWNRELLVGLTVIKDWGA